jgi:hypothetical protein
VAYGWALLVLWRFLALAPKRSASRRALGRAAVFGFAAAVLAADASPLRWGADLARVAGVVAFALALPRAERWTSGALPLAVLACAAAPLSGPPPALAAGAALFGGLAAAAAGPLGAPWAAAAAWLSAAAGLGGSSRADAGA